MKILVACEYSGVVRRAFRERGHEAFSCDLLPSEDDSPHHIQGDAIHVSYNYDWDMMIAHPPCTYLCNSGVWALRKEIEPTAENGGQTWTINEDRWRKMEEARNFFLTLSSAPIPKIVIENPVPHKYAQLPMYHQTIQPYQFGDDASKRTCLWLKGVPRLVIPDSSKWAQPRIVDGKKRWSNQTDSGQNRLGPSETRASERSRTYEGIARAFAEQWG